MQERKRLAEYPPRFRARIAGPVVHIRLPAAGSPLRYEAVVEIDKAWPLPPSSAHQLTGIPIIEVLDDESETTDVNAELEEDEGEQEESTHQLAEVSATSIPQYRVQTNAPKVPVSLFPHHPPLTPGQRVTLIWHGQKDVPGILAGTYVRCSGMLTLRPAPARMFNPRYEILPLRS